VSEISPIARRFGAALAVVVAALKSALDVALRDDPLAAPRTSHWEGLTKALKHAGASRTDVEVRYGAGEVQIEVRDNGRWPAGGDGLADIGERVKLSGGEVAAGRANGGGFVLSTRLPVEGGAR